MNATQNGLSLIISILSSALSLYMKMGEYGGHARPRNSRMVIMEATAADIVLLDQNSQNTAGYRRAHLVFGSRTYLSEVAGYWMDRK
jgi:hypothetical protein